GAWTCGLAGVRANIGNWRWAGRICFTLITRNLPPLSSTRSGLKFIVACMERSRFNSDELPLWLAAWPRRLDHLARRSVSEMPVRTGIVASRVSVEGGIHL